VCLKSDASVKQERWRLSESAIPAFSKRETSIHNRNRWSLQNSARKRHGDAKEARPKKYIEYSPYRGATLPTRASGSQRNHPKTPITGKILNDVLKLKKDEVHVQACEMEHALSDEAEESLCRFLDHPDNCQTTARQFQPAICHSQRAKNAWNCMRKILKKMEARTNPCADKSPQRRRTWQDILHKRRHKALKRLSDMGLTPAQKLPSSSQHHFTSHRNPRERLKASCWQGHDRDDICRGRESLTEKKLVIALAGNANVGKSVIFNYLTVCTNTLVTGQEKQLKKQKERSDSKTTRLTSSIFRYILAVNVFAWRSSFQTVYCWRTPRLSNKRGWCRSLGEKSGVHPADHGARQTHDYSAKPAWHGQKEGHRYWNWEARGSTWVPVVPTIAVKGVGVFQLLESAVETIEKGQVGRTEVRYGRKLKKELPSSPKWLRAYNRIIRWVYCSQANGGRRRYNEDSREQKPQAVEAAREFAREMKNCAGILAQPLLLPKDMMQPAAWSDKFITSSLRWSTIEERLHEITTHKIAAMQ